MLTSTYAEVLRVLDEEAGLLTGEAARRAKFNYGSNQRQRSGAVRSWLDAMKRDGLVRFLDDKKPVCWVRTPDGTAALRQFDKKS
jgi:hypothetical protein